MKSIAAALLGAGILTGLASGDTLTATVGVSSQIGSLPPVINSDSGTEVTLGSKFSEKAVASSFVGILLSASSPGGSINALANAFAEANSNIDDFLFSGPGNSVTVSVTLPFTSLSGGEYSQSVSGNSNAQGSLAFGVTFGQYAGSLDFGWLDDTDNVVLNGSGWTFNVVPTSICSGVACSIDDVSYELDGTVSFTTLVPVGVPVRMVLDVQGSCGGGGLPAASCQVDALDPFGIVPGFASFDLPDGYSVNADSIDLVNGQLPSSVPEPNAGILLGSACALMLALRRRYARRQLPIPARTLSVRPGGA